MPWSSDSVWMARDMPRPAKRSSILPTATTACPAGDEPIEQRDAGGLEREIPAVGRAPKASGLADERPRDDAADAQASRRELERDVADARTAVRSE